MKKMRRIASLLLAMVMAFGLTATAFAAEANADAGKVQATVTNETKHSYAAYQIFEGTQEAGNAALGDVGWGSGLNKDGSKLLTALQGDDRFNVGDGGANIFAGFTEAAQVAAALEEYKANPVVAAAFANLADKNRTGAPEAQIAAGATKVPLPVGYYLLVDTTNLGNGASDALNPALLQVTNNGDITIKKKYEVPTVDKSVTGTDGITGEATDCNIGDSVTFTLTGTLPGDGEGQYDGKWLDDYDSYKYIFHDTLSDGLQYNGEVKAYLAAKGTDGKPDLANKTEIGESKYEVDTGAEAAEGDTLTVTFEDLKKVDGVTDASFIIVEYSATLTEAAVIKKPGNTNTVKLEYSNNPNTDSSGDPSDGTGETPEDTVYVFTYELDGTKVDGQTPNKTLKDAQFVLYRGKDGADPTYADGIPTNVEYALVAGGKLEGWTESRETAMGTDGNGKGILVSDVDGLFGVSGLDAGIYYLEEVKAPAGYNLLKDPVKLTIDAEISGGDAETNQPPTIGKLDLITEGKDGSITTPGDKDNGTVSLEVQNNMGALLPSTGGMGTTLFYIAGAALVLAAGVLFMMKRRTDAGK